jgi:hypothetical protein
MWAGARKLKGDARFLAILLIKPKSLSAGELDRMVRSVTFVEVADWLISYVVKRHPDKETLRQGWTMNLSLAEIGIPFPDAQPSVTTGFVPRISGSPKPQIDNVE